MPQIAKDFNPEITEALANLAEIARAEDEFWSAETAEAFVQVHRNQQVDVPELLKLSLALRRRILRLAAMQAGATLDFYHLERILEQLGKHGQIELPNGFRAAITLGSVRFESAGVVAKPCSYSYKLSIPGSVDVAELGIRVSTLVITEAEDPSRYNDEPRLVLARHLPAREKALWPVALAGEDIVWMRGFPVASPYVARQGKAVAIEATPLTPGRN
jgi:hypothetical protein